MKLEIFDIDDNGNKVKHIDEQEIKKIVDEFLNSCNIGFYWKWKNEN